MSFTTTDPAARQALITGLRDLADYLASNPAVSVPRYGIEITVFASSTEDGGCAEVDRFARQLGVPVCDDLDHGGRYWAARSFGPVGYTMSAISDYQMARHHAETSYRGCVTPDAPPDTWT